MTELRISPSRLRLFEQRPRLWWLKEAAGWAEPQTPAHLQFGTDTHAVCEHLLTGRPSPHGGWAYELGCAFVELTRDACDVAAVEYDVRVELAGGHYEGRLDAWGWRGSTPVVVDHKTSSNPGKAKLTPEQMLQDLQVILYSYAMMEQLRMGPGSSVVAHWHWGPNKRRANALDGCVWTEVEVPYELARKAAETACATGRRMLTLAQELPPAPCYETRADEMRLCCSAYGGCPWLGRCGSIEGEREIMGIYANLKAKGVVTTQEPNDVKELPPETAPVVTTPQATVNPDPALHPAPVPALNPKALAMASDASLDAMAAQGQKPVGVAVQRADGVWHTEGVSGPLSDAPLPEYNRCRCNCTPVIKPTPTVDQILSAANAQAERDRVGPDQLATYQIGYIRGYFDMLAQRAED